MTKKETIIRLENGLEARPIALLVQVASQYDSSIYIEYGDKRVLLTCDKSNEASRRTIMKNGGKLENEVRDEAGLSECGIIQRYWITL